MANGLADHRYYSLTVQCSCAQYYDERLLKTMNKSRGVSTVAAPLVKNADEPASTGLPASPRPV